MSDDTLSVVIDALATHRLTKLGLDDEITASLREKILQKLDPDGDGKLTYFFNCPWCFSMWAGVGVVTARTIAPKAWRPLSYVLAFSSIVGLIEEHS